MASCRRIRERNKKARCSNELHVIGRKYDLWDRVRGLGSETWKGCE